MHFQVLFISLSIQPKSDTNATLGACAVNSRTIHVYVYVGHSLKSCYVVIA